MKINYLLAALATASLLVACEKKGGGQSAEADLDKCDPCS